MARTLKITVWSLGLGFAAMLILGSCTAAWAVEGPEIKIGVAAPLTGIGANAGKREVIGAQAAVNVINSKGGVNGVPLKLYIEDTASNPQEAVTAVRKLAGDNRVLAIVGPHYSSETETTFPLGNQLKIVQIAVASSKPGLSKANRPYAFRNTLTEDKLAASVVQVFQKKYNIKTVALMCDMKDAVSQSACLYVFPPALRMAGIKILTGDSPVTFQTSDSQVQAQITKLRAMNPDGIALAALGPDAINIITEARRQGMKQPFFGAGSMMEGDLPKIGGKAVEGTLAGSYWHTGVTSSASRTFMEAYAQTAKTLYPSPFTANPDYYPANAYDAVFMISGAIQAKKVSNKPSDLAADRDKIRQYLADLRNFQGVDSLGFDQDGDGVKTVYVVEAKDGKWRPIEAK